VENTLLSILSSKDNKYLPALLQLNQLYSDTSQLQLAQKQLTIANKLYPQNEAVMVAQAKLHIKLGNYQGAYSLLWATITNAPAYLPAYAQLYQLSNLGTGTQELMAHLEKLLIQEPNKHLLRNLLADTYLQNSERLKAAEHYNQLVSLENYPNQSSVLNNLAFIAIDSNLDVAFELVEKGLEITSKSASLIDTKGWILAKKAQYDQALVLLRQAYSMDSNDPGIRYHLAYTLNKLGRVDEAKAELTNAFALNVAFFESSEAKALQARL
jgi:Flp pilus assembly protein TadD